MAVQNKPLGQKAYGSIAHLPGSRLGPGDRHIAPGQAKIATETTRDKHDLVIVQEKLDGANVAVAKLNGQLVALTRSGYLAMTSPFRHHQYFAMWVTANEQRFKGLLYENERICGEWLALAHCTRYALSHEPFVAFDLINGNQRVPFSEFTERVHAFDFILPHLLHKGGSYPVSHMLMAITHSGHGAIDPVEGAIWRVERHGRVDFLCKYVQHFKQDGKYFAEITGQDDVWNCSIHEWQQQSTNNQS